MRFFDWLTLPGNLRSQKQLSRRATRSLRPSWQQPLAIALTTEELEDRTLLSGVTILTHGFIADLASTPAWLSGMANELADRITSKHNYESGENATSDQVAQFRLNVDHLLGNPFIVGGLEEWNGYDASAGLENSIRNSLDGEVVVTLDWSNAAGFDGLSLIPEVTTQKIASLVSSFLFNTSAGRLLISSPIHLIGHSRGASLVGALAEEFGELGVLVDQVTYLDTHPILLDYGYSILGTNVKPFENVIYADSYWRAGGEGFNGPNGHHVDGAYNVELDNAVFEGVGYGGLTDEHSDVHLWYHGTINPGSDIDDGEASAEGVGWYNGEMGPRDEIGYYFSRIAGGDRSNALSGLHPDLGGVGSDREEIANHSKDVWPGIVDLQVSYDDIRIEMGETLNVDFYRRDFDSRTTFKLFLDDDRNPYNNSPGQRQLGEMISDSSTGDRFRHQEFSVVMAGVAVGKYYVYGQISDGVRTRYAYAPEKITLSKNQSAGIDLHPFLVAAPAYELTLGRSFSLTPGQPFECAFQISNGSFYSNTEDSGPYAVEWYLSRDSTIDKSDVKIGRQNMPALAGDSTTDLTYRELVLPDFSHEIWDGNGTYYIGMIVDPDNAIPEYDETNNSQAMIDSLASIEIDGFSPLPEELIVRNSADESDGIYGNDLSLREAVELANANPNLENYDVITFDINTLNPEIKLSAALGELQITRDDLKIVGTNLNAAGGRVRINGQDQVRLFNVMDSNVNLKLWNLSLTNGFTSGDGGGIYNDGGSVSLLDGCLIQSCYAGDEGGAIYSDEGEIKIENSTIRLNRADDDGGGIYLNFDDILIAHEMTLDENTSETGRGGGIYSDFSRLTINDSLISNNISDDTGGGIRNSYGSLTVKNTSFVKNRSENDQGGGLYNTKGTVEIFQSTFSQNQSDDSGGGIYNVNGELTLTGSTLDQNSSSQSGGGIAGTGEVAIVESTISKNSAQSGGVSPSLERLHQRKLSTVRYPVTWQPLTAEDWKPIRQFHC